MMQHVRKTVFLWIHIIICFSETRVRVGFLNAQTQLNQSNFLNYLTRQTLASLGLESKLLTAMNLGNVRYPPVPCLCVYRGSSGGNDLCMGASDPDMIERENQQVEESSEQKTARDRLTQRTKSWGKSNWAFNYDRSKSRKPPTVYNWLQNDLQILHFRCFSFSDEDFERVYWMLNTRVETTEGHVLENKDGADQ